MNCTIRQWSINDAGALASILNNKNILDNLRDGYPYPYTEEDAKTLIHDILNTNENKSYAFAITIHDKVIGSIGIIRNDNIHSHTAEMGYFIAEEHWGKGYATETIQQACLYVFHNTDIIRIYAEPFADNIASTKVLEKSGFKYEGLLRCNAIKNGIIRDMKLYALIKDQNLIKTLVAYP